MQGVSFSPVAKRLKAHSSDGGAADGARCSAVFGEAVINFPVDRSATNPALRGHQGSYETLALLCRSSRASNTHQRNWPLPQGPQVELSS